VYEIQDHFGKGKILHLLGTFAFQIFIHLCLLRTSEFCHIHCELRYGQPNTRIYREARTVGDLYFFTATSASLITT
ncbi:hypothetical protein ACJX0J_026210, partial [Zea mays]